jgi:hypothetical protein
MQEINYSALSGIDIYNIIRISIRKIALICNSGFFLFSGYLFFLNVNSWSKEIYLKKLKIRIKTLFMPYISWNIINVLIRPIIIIGGRIIKKDGDWGRVSIFFNELLDKGILNIFLHYNKWGTGTNILCWLRPSMGPFSVPMWFLQTLIVLSLLTPIIYLICKYLKLYGIILLGLLYYTGIWFSIPGLGIGAVFFFTLGAYFGVYKKNLILELRRYKIFWYTISIVTLAPSVYYNGLRTYDYFLPIFILGMVISAVNIVSYLIEKKKLKVNHILAQATFFVYAIHSVLVLSIVGLIFDIIFKPKGAIILTIRYFTVPVVTAYVCVSIYCIMKKIMPKLLKILSGNR